MTPEQTELVVHIQIFISNPNAYPDCIDEDGKANLWRYINIYYPAYMHDNVAYLQSLHFYQFNFNNVRTYQPGNDASSINFSYSFFQNCCFTKADLGKTQFRGAKLTNFQVKQSVISACSFEQAYFAGEIRFEDSQLTDVDANTSYLNPADFGPRHVRNLIFQQCQLTRINVENLLAAIIPNDITAASVIVNGCNGDLSLAGASLYEINLSGDSVDDTVLCLNIQAIELGTLRTLTTAKSIGSLTLQFDKAACDNVLLYGQAQLNITSKNAIVDVCEITVTQAGDLNFDELTAYDRLILQGPVQQLSAQNAAIYNFSIDSPQAIETIDLTGLMGTTEDHISDQIIINTPESIATLILDSTGTRHYTAITADQIQSISLCRSALPEIHYTARSIGLLTIKDTNTVLSFAEKLPSPSLATDEGAQLVMKSSYKNDNAGLFATKEKSESTSADAMTTKTAAKVAPPAPQISSMRSSALPGFYATSYASPMALVNRPRRHTM